MFFANSAFLQVFFSDIGHVMFNDFIADNFLLFLSIANISDCCQDLFLKKLETKTKTLAHVAVFA